MCRRDILGWDWADPMVRRQTLMQPEVLLLELRGDLFAPEVDEATIAAVLRWIEQNPRSRFVAVTSYVPRARALLRALPQALQNLLLGARIERDGEEPWVTWGALLHAQARVALELSPREFLNVEGVLASRKIEWVRVMGDMGPDAWPLDPLHVAPIVASCRRYNVPVWVQWGLWAPEPNIEGLPVTLDEERARQARVGELAVFAEHGWGLTAALPYEQREAAGAPAPGRRFGYRVDPTIQFFHPARLDGDALREFPPFAAIADGAAS